MEKYQECPICLDIYGPNENDIHAPKVLKCGHTICKECLEEIIKNEDDYNEFFNCPQCTKKIKKKKNVDEYITNKEIIRQIKSCFNIHKIEEVNKNGDKPIEYKIILLGNTGVGKTSILRRFYENKFDICFATLGCEPRTFYIKYKNKNYKLLFFDTAGHEKYRAITRGYLRNTDGVLFVFDISDQKSFIDLPIWYNLYKEENENVVGLVIGNKCDLNHEVDENEAEEFATEHGLIYMKTSAKSDKYIKKAIVCLLKKVNESKIKYENISSTSTHLSLFSEKREEPQKKKCNC